MATMPDCPQCGGNRTYKFNDDPNDLTHRCRQYDAFFEPDDEGGNYCIDPTRRMQREEAREKKERQQSEDP